MTLRSWQTPAMVRWTLFALLVAWAFIAGKDVSWDVVNHQLYLPFAWLNGRFRTDFYGAGPQQYQYPLGYLPLYAMVRGGFPAWSIGVILAATHASMIWPLDRIAKLFWPQRSDQDFWLRTLALALSCIAPVFLIHEGTTSIDPFANLLILWAMALSLERGSENARDWRRACVAGVLLGLASALKLSNAVLALALCALWLLKWGVGQADLRRVAAFTVGLAATFVVCVAPWMFWLWQDFGNPIFPLYNNVFHSPYAPRDAITALRFVPATALGALLRLGELAQLSKFVSFEAFIPDIRPVLAVTAAVAAAAVLLARGGWRRLADRASWRTPGAQLAFALLAMYVLWIRSSGNSRYALTLFVLAGVALVRATQLALPVRTAKVVLLTVLLLQGAYYFKEGNFRFEKAKWDSGPYLEYQVPRRLREQPFLHLALGTQTNASVALFLDPRGALSNPIGQVSLPLDGEIGHRFQALLDQWHGRTRVLLVGPESTKPSEIERNRVGMRALLYRLGLDVDWSDCEPIPMVLDRSELPSLGNPAAAKEHPDRLLRSCAVLYTPQRDPAEERQHADAERVFAIMEAACPKVFAPIPFASEHDPGVWLRHYLNTDAVLFISAKDGVYFFHFREIDGDRYGSVEDVLAHRSPIKCPQISYQTPK